jgi:hypothetical protein
MIRPRHRPAARHQQAHQQGADRDRHRRADQQRGRQRQPFVGQATEMQHHPGAGRGPPILAAWSRAGWLARVRRGAYVPVPIESPSADIALEDPWTVATAMFAPCYIGGWSAAEHWGLTEQIFRSLCVMTTKRPRDRKLVLRKHASSFTPCRQRTSSV